MTRIAQAIEDDCAEDESNGPLHDSCLNRTELERRQEEARAWQHFSEQRKKSELRLAHQSPSEDGGDPDDDFIKPPCCSADSDNEEESFLTVKDPAGEPKCVCVVSVGACVCACV